jgi:arylsulfatase A-like enzyme
MSAGKIACLLALSVIGMTYAGEKPNIVFILADDLGYGDLGCYGQKRIKTPNIDKLAAEGTRFTQAYAGCTVCAPSRCALMSGKTTGHCTVRGNGPYDLRADEFTLSKLLKNNGYATGMFGKWGLGDPGSVSVPSKMGWDEFFGYLNHQHAHNYYPDHLFRQEEKVVLEKNEGGKKGQYTHDLFADEALSFISKHKDQPFFLYASFTIPHGNNEQIKNNDGMQVPNDEPYTNESWPQNEKNFAAMITRMDKDVGRIMARLQEAGLDDKTLVIFTSDNGPHHEGHDPEFFGSRGGLRGIKRDLYEGGIRVPAIARWPGRVKAGATSDAVWAFWDFLPTVADLIGVEAPKDLDGISVKEALLGGVQKPHEYLYWEFHERGFSQAVRFGDWKAVRKGDLDAPVEIFDLSKDLSEKNDIAKEHPEIVEKAKILFVSARTDSKEFPVRTAKKK